MGGGKWLFVTDKKDQPFSKPSNVFRALVFEENDALKKIPMPQIEKEALSACDMESRSYLGDCARVISGLCREAVWGHSGLSEKLGVFPGIGKGSSG